MGLDNTDRSDLRAWANSIIEIARNDSVENPDERTNQIYDELCQIASLAAIRAHPGPPSPPERIRVLTDDSRPPSAAQAFCAALSNPIVAEQAEYITDSKLTRISAPRDAESRTTWFVREFVSLAKQIAEASVAATTTKEES